MAPTIHVTEKVSKIQTRLRICFGLKEAYGRSNLVHGFEVSRCTLCPWLLGLSPQRHLLKRDLAGQGLPHPVLLLKAETWQGLREITKGPGKQLFQMGVKYQPRGLVPHVRYTPSLNPESLSILL